MAGPRINSTRYLGQPWVQENFTGLSKVAGDGTISATVTSTNPVLANLVGIIDNSDEFRMITIDPGTIVSCTFNTQAGSDEEDR